MPVIHLEKVTKLFKWEGRTRRPAVSEATLSIKQGEFVFVVGSSGAGKSTLLSLITGELRPDSGRVWLDKLDLAWVPVWHWPRVRQTFGRVWQDSRLMRRRTVRDNLSMVVRAQNGGRARAERMTRKALGLVGMSWAIDKFPAELSIGECRRVELARALINSPSILVLDELTANLDEDNIWDIMQLLIELNQHGTTVIMATHASQFVNILRKRVVTLVDGKILGDVKKGKYGDLV